MKARPTTYRDHDALEDALEDLDVDANLVIGDGDGELWQAFTDADGEWKLVRPRSVDDGHGHGDDINRPVGPVDLQDVAAPLRLWVLETQTPAPEVLFGVPLSWRDDQIGYQCPHCDLYVALPLSPWAICPSCPGIPVEEAADLALIEAAMDESDRQSVLDALGPLLNALTR